MLTKKLAEQLVKDKLDYLINLLNLSDATINLHVYHSTSKKIKKMSGYYRYHDLCGCCYSSSSNAHDVILFYNKHNNKREFISTMIHELLHVKFSKLSHLVTLKEEIAYKAEEKIVCDLEKVFIDLLE